VIADATTSVLAIAALLGGWVYGWAWLDPLTGIVGAILVGVWAKGLIVDTSKVLLDREMDHPVVDEIRQVIEDSSETIDEKIADLHVWRVGKGQYACAIVVLTRNRELTPDMIRERLAVHEEIVHSTIEIHHH
jgi:Co/Zn/Cd efflux system component